jgi:peptidoglycan/LPS O-acetylase OafA/YrhL
VLIEHPSAVHSHSAHHVTPRGIWPKPAPAAQTPALDSLRGLAALAVVFTHVLSMGPDIGSDAAWLLDATPLRAVHTGRAPVVFFFVLSGYVLALSLLRPDAPGPVAFALRRTLRLLLPVTGAVLLSAGLRAVFHQGPMPNLLGWDARLLWSEPVGLSMLLRRALLLGADYRFTLDIPLWSLVHEWRLSVVFPLVLPFRRRPALLLAAGLALHAAALTAGAAPDAVQLGPRLASTLVASAYFALPFAAGAALAFGGGLTLRGAARPLAWVGVAPASALPSDLGYVAASAALIVLARGPGLLPGVLAAPPLLRLGRVSFSLYLVHVPVLAAMLHATHGWLSPWAALAAGVPVSLLVAAAFHAWVEAPAHRLSRGVGGGRGGPATA